MRSLKAPGLTKVSLNVIKMWYNLGFPKRGQPDVKARELWSKVVDLIQCCWQGGIPTAFSLGVLVIIQKKDQGGVRGIGLLEAIHKVISQIINLCLADTINFCKEVNGFWKH